MFYYTPSLRKLGNEVSNFLSLSLSAVTMVVVDLGDVVRGGGPEAAQIGCVKDRWGAKLGISSTFASAW